MKYTKIWNVLIYSLVLVNLALLLALAMFNNFFVFLANTEWGNIQKKLSNLILEKGALYSKYSVSLNSNGSWVVDNIWCPENVSMSGETILSVLNTTPVVYSGSIYCSAIHSGIPYYIYFNPDFTGFSGALYLWDNVNLDSWGLALRSFVDADDTLLDISAWLPTSPDGIDDNFNTDNYSISASGSLMFPWNYIDDDAAARTTVYGYIPPDSIYTNILWSNTRVQEYIEENPNNNDDYYVTLWSVNSGYLYLDIDKDFDMKIIQFDKNTYNTSTELIPVVVEETTWISASIGYIQNNSWTLSLSGGLTWNEYLFDFMTNDYAIFLNNTGTWVLTYVLSWENSSWSGVYINAIDDSWAGSIKYLWAEMIQDDEKNYIWKIMEVTNKK